MKKIFLLALLAVSSFAFSANISQIIEQEMPSATVYPVGYYTQPLSGGVTSFISVYSKITQNIPKFGLVSFEEDMHPIYGPGAWWRHDVNTLILKRGVYEVTVGISTRLGGNISVVTIGSTQLLPTILPFGQYTLSPSSSGADLKTFSFIIPVFTNVNLSFRNMNDAILNIEANDASSVSAFMTVKQISTFQ